jgi:hypothetical protein
MSRRELKIRDPISSASKSQRLQLNIPVLPHPLETKVTQMNSEPFSCPSSDLAVQSLGAEHGE